jgi:hypothetical protein
MARDTFFDRPFVLPAILLGLGFFISAVAVCYTLYAVRALDNTLSVTGSAKQEVKADSGKWSVSVTRSAFEGNVTDAYARVTSDAQIAISYFKSQGIDAGSITANTVTADQDWSSGQNGGPVRYNVHEEITIESDDVDKIATLAQNVNALLAKGISVTPRQPEYYISTLPDLRVKLLGAAIADARARANSIAESGGSAVGKLKSAASGVVQVLAPNSTNIDDYGSYDTSTIQKEVSVTARATFLVK